MPNPNVLDNSFDIFDEEIKRTLRTIRDQLGDAAKPSEPKSERRVPIKHPDPQNPLGGI